MSKKQKSFPMDVPSGSVTVKIYRVKNKAFLVRNRQGELREEERFSFMVSYFSSGKRTQKMFAQFEAAHAYAKSVGNSFSNGELDVLELRSSDRQAYVHALANLQPTGMALELATQEYAEAWKALGGKALVLEAAREYARRHMHVLPDIQVSDAVQQLIDAKARDKASLHYLRSLHYYLGMLAKAFHGQVRSITTEQLTQFVRNVSGNERSKNHARAYASVFFTYCQSRGWLPRDHEGVSLIPKLKIKPADIVVFTPWQMAQFLTFAQPEFVPYLAIGAFTGLRSAEIVRLDWAEVHLADRFIEVKASKAKTASRRLVPITDNLAQWLAPHAQAAGRVAPVAKIQNHLTQLVRDTNAGLLAAHIASKKPGKFKPVRWHQNALRHSFISYRVAAVQDVPKVALEAGNSPAIIFQHYRELVRPVDAKAWFSIAPGKDGKIIFFEASKPAAKAEVVPEAAAEAVSG